MSDEKAVERIRGRHLALQNDRQEAMARPGKAEAAVVISRATLDYYKGLEALLEDAMELASANHPPIIEINAQAIGEAMTAAAVNAIAEVTGLQVPVLVPADEKPGRALPMGRSEAAVTVDEAAKKAEAVNLDPNWLSVDTAAKKAGVAIGPVMSAVYGGKIRKRGRGQALEVNAASFRTWAEAYKKRAGK